MRFFKKTFLIIPVLVVMILLLYGRKQEVTKSLNQSPKVLAEKTNISKQEVTKSLNQSPKVQKVLAEEIKCDPCNEKAQIKRYDQGYAICENDLPKAYNAPGRIDVCDGIDAFVTASFIYWKMLGDQLDLGNTVVDIDPYTIENQLIKFTTDFKPGFKVGLGKHFSHDDWDLYAQYTRLHETESTTYTPSNNPAAHFHFFWLEQQTMSFVFIEGDIRATWKMELDKIDLELGRSYYLGKNLIARPFVSLSGHWLDQRYVFGLVYNDGGGLKNYISTYKNDSWALGPRFGVTANWFFNKNFRLFGIGAISLLFSENKIEGLSEEGDYIYNQKKVEKNNLRDIEELMIGLGWGSYFNNDKWHFDLSAAYEAQRYSHTNYMYYYHLAITKRNLAKPGDLFLHGLTVSARFDF